MSPRLASVTHEHGVFLESGDADHPVAAGHVEESLQEDLAGLPGAILRANLEPGQEMIMLREIVLIKRAKVLNLSPGGVV
jgi:hypothetical protein